MFLFFYLGGMYAFYFVLFCLDRVLMVVIDMEVNFLLFALRERKNTKFGR